MASPSRAHPNADVHTKSAVSRARLEAHEEERSRLAEELHDGPAQALANAIFQTELLERAMMNGTVAASVELNRLREMLARELETLRAYISQLRPPLNEPEALEQALQDAATSLTEYTGIPVDVRLDASSEALAPAARNVALRVAQEALRNVGKHSGAQRSWLATRLKGNEWELEVGDNGHGFDPDGPAPGHRRRHFGLRFMRERTDLLGARLSIETRPAAGTVVRLRISTAGERS